MLQFTRAIRKTPFRASLTLLEFAFKKYRSQSELFCALKGAPFIAMYPDNSSCKHDHYLNTCDE